VPDHFPLRSVNTSKTSVSNFGIRALDVAPLTSAASRRSGIHIVGDVKADRAPRPEPIPEGASDFLVSVKDAKVGVLGGERNSI
jgi:hypothetical protein